MDRAYKLLGKLINNHCAVFPDHKSRKLFGEGDLVIGTEQTINFNTWVPRDEINLLMWLLEDGKEIDNGIELEGLTEDGLEYYCKILFQFAQSRVYITYVTKEYFEQDDSLLGDWIIEYEAQQSTINYLEKCLEVS